MRKLSINLNGLADNYRALCAKAGAKTTVGASVKANGYGLGLIEVTRALHGAGCHDFFVATLQEGQALREALADVNIACFNGLSKGYEEDYAAYNLIPILGSIDEMRRWKDCAPDKPVMLHIDTGMNRHGLPIHDVEAACKHLDSLNITHFMSHFSSSEEPDNSANTDQFDKFMRAIKPLKDICPHAKLSMCNSSGLFLNPDYHLDLVRPGMALYGLNPASHQENPMAPVVKLEAPILQFKEAEAGTTAGYNETYRFDKNTSLAIIDIGYGDGLPRSLSNTGAFYIGGVRCPIRGRVSMDLTIIDISDVPDDKRPAVGDMVEVIGEHQSADDLARDAGTIGYEILTSLGARYERTYVS